VQRRQLRSMSHGFVAPVAESRPISYGLSKKNL
jgi:hypothetical protein